MPSKVLKALQMLALIAAAAAIGIFVAIIVFPVQPSPTERAAFSAWEASQTHQEAHGATQTHKVKP